MSKPVSKSKCLECRYYHAFTFKDVELNAPKASRTSKYARERCGFSGMAIETNDAPILKCNRFVIGSDTTLEDY
jgi:hypothetical protein